MTTLEIVKSRIESLDRKVNSSKEFEAVCPVIKRQRVSGKMCYILQNPESLKFAVITELQVDELNEFYHFAMTGISIDDDPFIFKA